tara:strand:+ start:2973 stop:3689 length:717 start_codon:yes stop_codon:yes gene_type:complete
VANQNYIDGVADTIATQVETLQKEMVRDLLKLSKDRRFRSIDEFLLAIDELNIEQIVLIKAQNIINGYNVAHTQILADMTLFAEVTENTLQALTNFSQSSFADSLGRMGGVIKNEIVKGALGEATEQGILQAIQQQAGLSNAQMKTLVTTGLNDYSASVGKIMIDEAPDNTKFRYVGAIDDRTRDLCLQIWEAGAMTEKEIKSRFGSTVLVERGGFNCRHQWLPVEASDESKDARTDA